MEKDPHILMQSAQTRGIELEITSASRLVNVRQPIETVAFISAEIARRNLPSPLRITILGMAFKGVPATDDLRGSMSIKVLDALKKAHPDAEINLVRPGHSPPESLAAAFPDVSTCARIGDAVNGCLRRRHREQPSLAGFHLAADNQ